MVLGEQRVGGVGAVRVGPDFVLMLSACVNNGRGSLLELLRSSSDERGDIWREKTHDEESDLFSNFFDEVFKTRDLGDDTADGADNLVTELENGVDLGDDGLWI